MAELLTAEAVLVAVGELVPHPRNANQGDVGLIESAIGELGFYGGVVAQRSTGHILVGNHRVLAARQAGIPAVPVFWADVDDDTALRIMLVDNRSRDKATYAKDLLASIVSDLAGSPRQLAGTGWTPGEADGFLQSLNANLPVGGATNPDDAPNPPKRARSKRGQVWLLGQHRLAVGDARDHRLIDLALRAEGGGVSVADAVVTDPPYGVEYTGKTPDRLRIDGDAPDGLEDLLRAVLGAAAARLKPGGAWWCFGPAGPECAAFVRVHLELGVWRQTLLWVKNHFVMGRQDYHYRHENLYAGEVPSAVDDGPEQVLVGWKTGASHTKPPDRRQDTVWEYPRPSRSAVHPTMKPVAMLERAIRNSTAPGDVVLDPFAGSGSTLIACHRAGRRAALVEKDVRYVDVICRRWQDHTGIAPINEATGKTVDFSRVLTGA